MFYPRVGIQRNSYNNLTLPYSTELITIDHIKGINSIVNESTGLLFTKLLMTTCATLNTGSINYDNKELVSSFVNVIPGSVFTKLVLTISQ